MKNIFILFFSLLSFVYAKGLKVIALDWAIAETMMILDYQPLAVGDKRIYNVWVKKPLLPDNVKDVGFRAQPNIEYIIGLKPDLIITSSLFSLNNNVLKDNIKIVNIDFYRDKQDVYSSINDSVLKIGMILDEKQKALEFIKETKDFFSDLKQNTHYSKSIAVVQFIDKKYLRIYTRHSLYGAVIEQLGLKNAYKKSVSNVWGIDTISFLDLLKLPRDTKFIVIKPTPFRLDQEIKHNPFYQKMDILKDYSELEAIWSAGSLMSMRRFAEELIKAIR